uniref:L-Fucosyltransferase n=1 Tax=Timema genevievae TaxID=629358 RepID=A0A7R9JSD1_TIMGE|nr:unnamed protein product [Timema genevievae]
MTHENLRDIYVTQSFKRPSLDDDGSETPGDCPEGRILTVEPWTSLESQLWQYASVWAVSRLYDDKLNIFPRVPHFIFNTLRVIFDSLSIKSLASVPKECLKLNKSQRLMNDEILKYNPSTQYDKTIVLEGASTRYHDIIKVGLADFKSEFKFIPSLVEYANNYLNKARMKLIKKFSDLIYVGVQVQRTVCSDMERNDLQKIVRIADKQFYLLAIKHMMVRYSDAVFIIVSDSPGWCEQNLITRSNWPRVYLEPHDQTLAQQMAVIAHCNHTIVDQGGLWAFTAMLAGGDTFVYDPGEQVVHFSGLTINWTADDGEIVDPILVECTEHEFDPVTDPLLYIKTLKASGIESGTSGSVARNSEHKR